MSAHDVCIWEVNRPVNYFRMGRKIYVDASMCGIYGLGIEGETDMQIHFETATIKGCDYLGRTAHGTCAVVTVDGREVFRSKPHSKRIMGRMEAETWVSKRMGWTVR